MVTIYKGPSEQLKPRYSECLFVHFKYDPKKIALMKLLPLRRYDHINEVWEVPVSALGTLLKMFKRVDLKGELIEMDTRRDIQAYKDYLRDLKPKVPFDFRTKPDGHQIECFNILLEVDKLLIADQQGLGKTKEAIDALEYRKKIRGYERALIIPKASLIYNWGMEIDIHGRSNYLVVDGPLKKRLKIIEEYRKGDYYYLIIGYDAIKRHDDDLWDIPFNAVVLDEPTKIANPKSQVSKSCVNLIHNDIKPEMILLLSGTPIRKSPLNAWVPLKLLGVESRSYYYFGKDYCIGPASNSGPFKNLPDLHARLNSVMLRRTKDILDLPPKRRQNILVTMGSEQEKLHKDVKGRIITELDSLIKLNPNPMAITTRLRQITTNPAILGLDVPSAKQDYLFEHLEEILDDPDQKAIVYTIFRDQARILQDLFRIKFGNDSWGYIDGSIKPSHRQEQVNRFQEDKNCRIMLGTIDSCKEGFTLTAATNVIFLDLSWVEMDNLQAEDRAHRKGQTRLVNIYRYLCRNSIDRRVVQVLDRDARLITSIVEGKGAGIIKSRELLKFLLS